MSKLEELINELCPDGVEYVPLKQIAGVGTGSSDRVNAVENGEYPFYVRSKTIYRSNRYLFDEESIVIPGEGGIGDIFHYVNGKYDLHQRAYRIHFIDNVVDTKFAYYYLSASFKKFILMKAVNATVTSIRKPMIEDFPFPLPPLPVQREIVRILDNFTELTAELVTKISKELTAREEQYEFYRNKLINELCPDGVEYKKLWEVTVWNKRFNTVDNNKQPKIIKYHIYKSNDLDSMAVKNGNVRIMTTYDSFIKDGIQNTTEALAKDTVCEGEIIAIPGGGNTCVQYYKGKFITADNRIATSIDTEYLNNKFLYYYLQNDIDIIRTYYRGAGIKHPDMSKILEMSIPILPITVQNNIVGILDDYTKHYTKNTGSLGKELVCRIIQYEYYRDKLLTFKEKPQ